MASLRALSALRGGVRAPRKQPPCPEGLRHRRGAGATGVERRAENREPGRVRGEARRLRRPHPHRAFLCDRTALPPPRAGLALAGRLARVAVGLALATLLSAVALALLVLGAEGAQAQTNTAPQLDNEIPDQAAIVGTAFSYAFPANTFSDADTSDTLTYTAAQSDDTALPSWLTFTDTTRTFSGTPSAAGTVSVKVTASDGTDSVSDTFDIEAVACATDNVWCTVLTVGDGGGTGVGDADGHGYCNGAGNANCGYGNVADDDFELVGTTYTVEAVRWGTTGEKLHLTLDQDFPAAERANLTLRIGADDFELDDAGRGNTDGVTGIANNYRWNLSLSAGYDGPASGGSTVVQLLHTPAPIALVSNTDQTLASSASSSFQAQSFGTGDNTAGYTLTSIDVRLTSVTGRATSVTVRENNSSDEPGDLVATLTNPASLSGSSLNTFTVPSGTTATLDPNTTYWVSVGEGVTGNKATLSLTSSEDETGESGWTIGNSRLNRISETANWTEADDKLIIKVNGTLGGGSTTSTDATLSALALKDASDSAVTLTPTFTAATTAYTASVANAVDEITVTPTKSHANATVAWLDGTDATLTDADAMADDFQVDLGVGDTVFKVKVTAEDTTSTQTYTVTVTRAAPASTVLVSNMSQSHNDFLAMNTNDGAQAFTTGANVGGYLLTSVVIRFHSVNAATATYSIGIWSSDEEVAPSRDGDSLDEPHTSLGTLVCPAMTTTQLECTTTGIDLEKQTSYLLVIDSSSSGNNSTSVTTSNTEDSASAAGWSIANTTLYRDRTSTGNWTSWDRALRFRVNGTVTAASTDATLSALALNDASDFAVTLTPVFNAATTAYTASVANTVDEITVTPTTGHANATVAWLDGNDAALDDADAVTDGFQVDLDVGDTVFKVKVTAEDTTSTQTYTVTVTRAAGVVAVDHTVLNDWGLKPSGLSVDDKFRLIFGSTTKLDATSATIGDYNTFVQNLVKAGHTDIQAYSAGFRVVGCTGDVDARDNTATTYTSGNKGVPIYWLNGSKAADDYDDFYDGTWDDEANPKNQNGADRNLTNTANKPFTGCKHNGTEFFSSGGDSRALGTTQGSTYVTVGNLNSTVGGYGPLAGSSADQTVGRPFYGLSGVFRVGATIPDATGAPSIDGTPQVDQMLTAGAGDMADADGLPTTTFPDGYKFQWARVSGGTEIDIPGATSQTYTPVDADVGAPLKVKVSFTDGSGGEEALTSTATEAVAAKQADCATDRADSDWCTTLTVGSDRGGTGTSYGHRSNNYGALVDPVLDDGGTDYTIQGIWMFDSDTGSDYVHIKFADGRVAHGVAFNFGGATFTAAAANELSTDDTRYRWDRPADLVWIDGQLVTVSADTHPSFVNGEVNGTSLELNFSQNLDTNSVPAAGQFSVSADGAAGVAPSNVAVSGKTVTLTLATAVTDDQTVRVSYTKPTANPLQDATLGLDAPGFSDELVQYSVSIEAEYDTIGAGLDNLEFTLTRGVTAGALDATVTLTQDEDWLETADLTHAVSFVDGSAETTLTIGANKFSFTPTAPGDVIATVSGTGIIGGEDTVRVISTAEPPITLTYDKTSYTFAEDAAASDVVINLVATLDAAYPRGPTSSFFISASTVPGTAESPEDYFAFGVQGEFSETDFTRTAETDPWVATKRLEDSNGPFRLRDDDVDEDDETLAVNIQQSPGFRVGLVQLIKADNSTCLIGSFCEDEWQVTITDDDDAPVLGLTGSVSSIAEEDDDTTMDVAENAVTLTVASTNGKIFEDDQTLTLTFGGSATYGTHYQVTPVDADTATAGHQVALPGEPALIQAIKDDGLEVIDGLPLVAPTVELTVTAAANDSGAGDRTIQVTGVRDGTQFGVTVTVTIVDDDASTTDSTDATLSALALKDASDNAVTLTPTFAAATTAYTASVANAVDQITVTPTTGNANATVEWLDGSDAALADADSTADGFQVDLGVGDTVFKVKVTAEDTTTTQTYAVTVTRASTNPGNATGKPTVSGTAAVGEALSASTSGISDTDGKSKADNGDAGYAYTYQWYRVDADGASNRTAISGATSGSYTPVAADVGKKLIVEVSFVDDGDVSEGPLASDPYPSSGTVTATTGNATGKPTVSGTAAVGEALSASTSGISDTDGKTKADNGDAGYAYTYQWYRVDSDGASNRTAISGATSGSYTPVAADVGKKLIVEVSFVDDGDVSEGPLASDPYPSSGTVTATTGNTAPTLDNAIDDQTATVGRAYDYTVPSNTFNDPDGDTLTYTAAQSDDTTLPTWLAFDGTTRTFSGTPGAGDVGTVSVKVTASDATDSVSDTFDIRVRADTSGPLELTVRMLDDEITEGEPVRYRIEMSRRTGWVEVRTEYAYRGRFMETEPTETTGDMRSSGGLLYWEVERDTVDDGTAEDDGSFTVKLRPGAGYSLGTASSATVRILDNDEPVPVHAEVSVTDAEVEEGPGAELVFAVTLDNALSTTATVDWETLDGAGSRAAVAGQDYEGGSGTLTFRPGETRKTVRVRVHDDNDEQPESMVLLLSNPSGMDMSGDGSVGVGRILARVMISVKDVEAQERENEKLTFTVALDRARDVPVTVDYETVDGTATAGADYRAKSGTLTFRPGDRWELVRVDILDDSHNEGVETMKLRLSNPSEARFSGGVATLDATGRINNTDPMPAAWIARLGRAASDNVIEAVSGRWQGADAAPQQTHFTFGGGQMDGLWADGQETPGAATPTGESAIEGAWAHMDRMRAEAPAGGNLAGGNAAGGGLAGGGFSSGGEDTGSPGAAGPAMPSIEGVAPTGSGMSFVDGLNMAAGAAGDARWAQWLRRGNTLLNGSRTGLRELLMNSSFFYSPYSGDGDRSTGWLGDWAVWGQSAATRFSGAEQALGLNGEVATALVGFDSRRGRWLAGMALSYTEAHGGYSHPLLGGGTLSSVLTGLHPYAHFELNERTQLWGVLGYGGGDLVLTPQAEPAGIETGLTHSMAALGGRTALGVAVRDLGRFELAVRADARFTDTASEAVVGLSGASGATSRVRALLEGRGTLSLAGGAVLMPMIEAGLRYDAGDAETGAGLEMGAGLGFAMGRIMVQVNARGLLAHQDAAYEEWGYSASVTYRAEADGRGLSLKLGSVRGQAQSGLQALWNQPDAANLAGAAGAMAGAQSLSTQIGYGFDGPFGAALWHPFLAVDSAAAERRLRLGLEIASGDNASMALEIGRREMLLSDSTPPELALQLQGSVRW